MGGYSPGVGRVEDIFYAPIKRDGSIGTFRKAAYPLPKMLAALECEISGPNLYLIGGINESNSSESTIYRTIFSISTHSDGDGVRVATPVFSPSANSDMILQSWETSYCVKISTNTSGATIRYTKDNSDPVTSDTASTGTEGSSEATTCFTSWPGSTPKSMTIRAYAYKSGYEDSFVARAGYTKPISIPAKIRKTGVTTSVKTGDDGDHEWGATWPSPRFVNNGNDTMTDRLTGLMWERSRPNLGYSWADAIDYGRDLTLGSYTDWRLPNIHELLSLIYYGGSNLSYVWLQNQGFSLPTLDNDTVDVQYWSSTNYSPAAENYWSIFISPHGEFTRLSSTDRFWPSEIGNLRDDQPPENRETTTIRTAMTVISRRAPPGPRRVSWTTATAPSPTISRGLCGRSAPAAGTKASADRFPMTETAHLPTPMNSLWGGIQTGGLPIFSSLSRLSTSGRAT